MKKIAYLLLAITLVLTSIQPFAVFSEPTLPTFSVTNAEGKAGDTVTVLIQMSENPGVSSLFLRVEFDRDKLEPISAENVDLSCSFSDLSGNKFYEGNPITFNWIDMSKEITTATTLAKLTFKIKDDAKPGEIEIKVAYDQVDIFDMDMNDVVFDTISGTVTIVCEHTYSDWTNASDTQHSRTCSKCGNTETADHAWDDGKVTTSATHTTEGVKTYTCTECGQTKTESIDKTTDHAYGDWKTDGTDTHTKECECGDKVTEAHKWNAGEVTKHPSHMSEGEKTYTCTECGQTKTESIDKTTDHAYGDWKTDGTDTHTKECECGDKVTEAHKWNAGEVTTAPTHTTEGVKTYTCTECGQTKTESIDKIADHAYGDWTTNGTDTHTKECECGDKVTEAHKWNAGEVTTAPTHTTEGVKTYTCTECGQTKTESIDKTTDHAYGDWTTDGTDTHTKECECGDKVTEAHKWNAGEVTTAPTHTTEGVMTYTCTECGETKTEAIAVIVDCVWDEGVVTTPATHLSEGTKTFTCSVCGETKNETVPAIADHAFEGAWESNANGHWQKCECGEEGTVAAHTYGDWKIIKEATETEKGSKERSCSVCEYKETAEIDVLPPSTPDAPPTGDKTVIFISAALVALAGVSAVALVSQKKRVK